MLPPSSFFLSSGDSNPAFTVESWCNSSTIEHSACQLFYYTDRIHNSTQEHCFNVTNTFGKIFSTTSINSTLFGVEDMNVCFSKSEDQVPVHSSYSFCNESVCKLLLQKCAELSLECSNPEGEATPLFFAYIFLICIHYTSHSCVFRFYDVTIVSLVAEHGAAFGRQRVSSIIGYLIGPSLIGYIMQLASGNDQDYSLVFVFYGIFTILTALTSWNLNIRYKAPAKNMWKKIVEFMKIPDILAVILILLVLGTSFNFMLLYSNWFLEDLGASKMLLGLVMPLSSAPSLFVLYSSKWWLQTLGEDVVFIVALLGYAFYNVFISFLVEPWYSVLAGVIAHTFSYHLLWILVVEFVHAHAPEGLHATVVVTSGVIHYLLCRGVASFVGGIVIDMYGIRAAFRVIGAINLVAAIAYAMFCHLRRSNTKPTLT